MNPPLAMIASHYLSDIRGQFETHKKLAERAIAQVDDEQLHVALDPESNSLAVIMRHMVGNLRSRFTDFLTSDGEKPNRNRDAEFELEPSASRAQIMADWADGWSILFAALDALGPEDLPREVRIGGIPHSVVQALDRALAHQAYHAGQIVFLAKHLRSAEWKSLSIPRRRPAPR